MSYALVNVTSREVTLQVHFLVNLFLNVFRKLLLKSCVILL